MRYGLILFAFLFFAASSARSQEDEWEPIGATSFEAIAGVEDGGLLLIQYPGTVLPQHRYGRYVV